MDEEPAVDWSALDKLQSGKWASEVLRTRRRLVEQAAKSDEAVKAVKKVADRDKKALQDFDDALRPRMRRRRKRLLRLLGSRIKTDDGEITIKDVKRVLDHDPKRNKELVAELERRRVRKAIRIVKQPDFEVLGTMSAGFIRSLKPFGVSLGQMFYVSIKSTGEEKPTNIVRHRREGR